MKKILVAFVMLLAASVMGQQNPYQLKNLQAGTTDVTTMTNTINAWKSFGSGFKANSLVTDTDSQWAIKTDNHVYRFNPKTKAWEQWASMGTSVYMLAMQPDGTLYGLIPTSQCPGQYGVFWFNGSAWTARNGCYVKLSAGTQSPNHSVPAGIIAGINSSGQMSYSTDNANTWTPQPGTWTSISLGATGYGCAVDSSHNVQEIIAGQAPDALPAIPSVNGQVIGCLYASDPTTIMAWTSTGYVYSMPLENFGSWQVVTGMSATKLTGIYRYFLFGQDSSNVYHWNVNAPTLSATYGGQWNVGLGCPDPSHPCNSSTTHTLSHTMNFKTGHGYLGGLKQSTDVFTHDIEVPNIVYNPSCDPFFGQQADQECVAEIGTTAFCNQSHADMQQQQDEYNWGVSTEVLAWVQNSGGTDPYNVPLGAGGIYRAQVASETNLACLNGQTPVCASTPDVTGNIPIGSNLSCAYADMAGNGACDTAIWNLYYDYIEGKPSPWVFYTPWWSKNGVVSCMPFAVPGIAYWGISPPVDCN